MAGIFGLLMSGAGVIKDQYFNLTSLLLPGNGTNGAQNNTFLDSGTANSGSGFTITRNGNTTQGTFSPFSQTGWSNYFGSSTANIVFASDASFGVGTGNFSIELSVNFNAWTGNQVLFLTGTSTNVGITLDKPSSGNTLRFSDPNGTIISYSWTPNIGQWYNIAVVRAGTGTNQTTLYIDGVAVATGTSTASLPAYTIMVGGINYASPYNIQGYISNLRFSNVARTISNPTSFFTSDANTLLLTCRSNRFVDISGTPKTISQINGTTSVTPFSPFAPTQSYSAAAVGGSGYFDGNSDYLSVANQTALQLSGSQFTIEGWFYFTTSGVDNYIVVQSSALADANVNWLVRVTSGNKLRVLLMTSGATAVSFDGSTTVTANSWHHFAATCDGTGAGSNVRSWLDGVYQGGTTVNTANINTNSAATQIGGWSFASSYSTGYVSNLRILKGTALYTGTSDIAVPTAPLTDITNTSLLLNFTNAGVVDATAKNVLETVGNAQISTTQSKWGGGSISFDGTSGTYSSGAPTTVPLGSGDFVVECWVYLNASKAQGIFDTRATNSSTTGIALYLTSGNVWQMVINNAGFNVGGSITNSVWTHVAVVRTSTTLYVYVAGSLVNSSPLSNNLTDTTFLLGTLRDNADATTTWKLNGYVDDLRITKGYNRGYTGSTITVPAAPFPAR